MKCIVSFSFWRSLKRVLQKTLYAWQALLAQQKNFPLLLVVIVAHMYNEIIIHLQVKRCTPGRPINLNLLTLFSFYCDIGHLLVRSDQIPTLFLNILKKFRLNLILHNTKLFLHAFTFVLIDIVYWTTNSYLHLHGVIIDEKLYFVHINHICKVTKIKMLYFNKLESNIRGYFLKMLTNVFKVVIIPDFTYCLSNGQCPSGLKLSLLISRIAEWIQDEYYLTKCC